MVDKNASTNEPVEHIGAAAHGKRNKWIVVGVLVAGGIISLFYWHSGKSDDVALAELQRFRQAMATECKQQQFSQPISKELSSLYADSSRMQTVVVDQLGILRRGQPNCDQIIKALKSVDFPVQ